MMKIWKRISNGVSFQLIVVGSEDESGFLHTIAIK